MSHTSGMSDPVIDAFKKDVDRTLIRENLRLSSEVRQIFGLDVRFVDLETLIHLERAAGRPEDLERIAELEAIAEERDGHQVSRAVTYRRATFQIRT